LAPRTLKLSLCQLTAAQRMGHLLGDPSLGRGASIGLLHAGCLRDVLQGHERAISIAEAQLGPEHAVIATS
jgi:hypothetical protein